MCVCVYIYIYSYFWYVDISLYIYTCMYTHKYIYIYIERERETEKETERFEEEAENFTWWYHICCWWLFNLWDPSSATPMEQMCELQRKLYWKINLIWLHSTRTSWSVHELFSCILYIYIYIYIYICMCVGGGCVNTIVWMHHLDSNETHGEKAW